MLQGILFQVQVLKPCKSIQESRNEVQDFKAIATIYRSLKAAETHGSTASSIDRVSVKVYEVQFFRTVFHLIREYVFRLSFFTTLNIYKDYFKDRKR